MSNELAVEGLQFWVRVTMQRMVEKDAEIARLSAEGVRLDAQLDACMQGLVEIHNYAHDCSTGPTVPDHFWAIREMAMRLIKDDAIDAAQSKP